LIWRSQLSTAGINNNDMASQSLMIANKSYPGSPPSEIRQDLGLAEERRRNGVIGVEPLFHSYDNSIDLYLVILKKECLTRSQGYSWLKRTTISLSEAEIKNLKALATKEHRPISRQIIHMMDFYMNNHTEI
jgi:hypothetical protein